MSDNINNNEKEGFDLIVHKFLSFFKTAWRIISYKKIVLVAVSVFTAIILFALIGPLVLRGPYEQVRVTEEFANNEQFISTQNFEPGEVGQTYNISGNIPSKLKESNTSSFLITGKMFVWEINQFGDLETLEGSCQFILWRGNSTNDTINDVVGNKTVQYNELDENYQVEFELENTTQNLESPYSLFYTYLGNPDYSEGDIQYTLETRVKWISIKSSLQILQPPSINALFGTDQYGYDAFAQLSHAARNSLKVGLFAGIIATSVAVVVGAVAGYMGKYVDEITQLVVNIFLVFPVFPLLIILAAFVEERSLLLVSGIIASISWPWATRSIRSQILSLKERDFVRLAKISGKNGFTIAIKELLPNMFSYILLIFAVQVGSAIGAEAGISLLGFGPDPKKHITLGTMLFWVVADQLIQSGYWWLYLPPGLILTILFVILYILQSNLDEIFNPRLRSE